MSTAQLVEAAELDKPAAEPSGGFGLIILLWRQQPREQPVRVLDVIVAVGR